MTIERMQSHWGFSRMPFGRNLAPGMLVATRSHSEAVARIGWLVAEGALGIVDRNVVLLDPDDCAVLPNPAQRDKTARGIRRPVGGERLTILRMNELEAELGVRVVLFGCVAGHLGDGRIDVLEAAGRRYLIAKYDVLGVLGQQVETFIAAAMGIAGAGRRTRTGRLHRAVPERRSGAVYRVAQSGRKYVPGR